MTLRDEVGMNATPRTKPCEESCPKCGGDGPRIQYCAAMYGIPEFVRLECVCGYTWRVPPMNAAHDAYAATRSEGPKA
jgi:hypothetical protein